MIFVAGITVPRNERSYNDASLLFLRFLLPSLPFPSLLSPYLSSLLQAPEEREDHLSVNGMRDAVFEKFLSLSPFLSSLSIERIYIRYVKALNIYERMRKTCSCALDNARRIVRLHRTHELDVNKEHSVDRP